MLAAMFISHLPAQAISIELQPEASFSLQIPNKASFSTGYGIQLGVDFIPPSVTFLHESCILSYTSTSVLYGGDLSLFSFGVGGGVHTSLFDRLRFSLTATAGFYSSFYKTQAGGSLFYSIEAEGSLSLIPSLAIGIGGGFIDYLSAPDSFYRALKARIGISYRPVPEKATPKLEIPEIKLSPIFPVFYKYFDTSQLGTVSIKNMEKGTISKVAITFLIPQFMDSPKLCAEIPSMQPGEAKEVGLYALLKDSVLGITEGTKVAAVIRVSYLLDDTNLYVEKTESVRIYDRNAMTWEDDRRAAAFVTAKDPMVMRFSKAVNGMVRDDPNPAVSLSFRIAMAMFQGLGLYGVHYTVSPNGSYADYAVNKYAVDYLQFPRQTLAYKGGDCSDIAILFSALLESLGIETAFITVPGHVFIAFAPGIDQSEARNLFSSPEDLFTSEGKPWIPVEITMVQDGFLKAWQEGAREWRENTDTRAFFPLHECWKKYEPAGLQGDEGITPDIAGEELKKLFHGELASFTDREVSAWERKIKVEDAYSNTRPAALNKLGVLYARFGLMNMARMQFEEALRGGEYSPALVNMGNIFLLEKDWQSALAYYERARTLNPQDARILISMAKAEYEREDYGAAKSYYEQAASLVPDLARKYSFLTEKSNETARAMYVQEFETLQWSEDEG
jgi:tetratricopeptide (TPR) repeat protein